MNKQKQNESKSQNIDFKQAKSRLASNPETSPEVLEKLANKNQPEVVERVAENPQTPPQTLEKLSGHDVPEVRVAVTENKNTPIEAIKSLAKDDNPDVRYRLAENPETPPEVLQDLLDDENPYVVARAKETLKHTQSIVSQADSMLLSENFNEAEKLYREAIAGLETVLGAEHAEVATVLHKLAASLVKQGKGDEASEIERRASIINSAHK
jgi:hypothetical protein